MRTIKEIRENISSITDEELQKEIDSRNDRIWDLRMADSYDGQKIQTLKSEVFEITRIKERR